MSISTFALIYGGCALVMILQARLRGLASMNMRSFEDWCWLAGTSLLWPLVLVLEVRFIVRQRRFEREQREGTK